MVGPSRARVYIGSSVAHSYLTIKALPGNHGNGLFALVALAANTRIEMVGLRISATQRNRLLQLGQEEKHRHQLAAYIVAAGRRDEFIDGHPRHEGSRTWYASRANEPDPHTTANMLLVMERAPIVRPVLVTVRAVAAHEQLTVHYGTDYRRSYRVGCRARRPVWL